MKVSTLLVAAVSVTLFFTLTAMTMDTKKKKTTAFLEVTLDVKAENRAQAGGVYLKYKQPFLDQIPGATSKDLLLRTEDVQVIHGFESEAEARAYLTSDLFEQDVVRELKPYLEGTPDVRVYSVFSN